MVREELSNCLQYEIQLLWKQVKKKEAISFAYGNGPNVTTKSDREVGGEDNAIEERDMTDVRSKDQLYMQPGVTLMAIERELLPWSLLFLYISLFQSTISIKNDGMAWCNCSSILKSSVGSEKCFEKDFNYISFIYTKS